MAVFRLELSGSLMGVLGILLLLAIVLTVMIVIQRSLGGKDDPATGGADVIAYLVLALAMGVAGFALAELASTAFPGDRFVFDPADELATALSALVVSTPFLIYFWRRQAARREAHPESAGWTLYLSLIELVFMTAFVIVAVLFLNGLVSDETTATWPGVVIFGAILVFHDLAARRTPPLSDAGETQRVLGSAVALIAGGIGLAGVLVAAMSWLYETLGGEPGLEEFHPWLAMLIVGAPVWWYRWVRPWPAKPAVPRITWSVIVALFSMLVALGAVTAVGVVVVQYLFADTPAAGEHFELVPIALGLLLAALPVWLVHRRLLGDDPTEPVQFYRYALAALGLGTAVATAIGLTIIALDRDLIVGGSADDVLAVATVLVAGLVVWLVFGRTASEADVGRPIPTWPRRIYTLGVGLIFSLVAAGALITTIFIVLQRVFDAGGSASLLEPLTIFVFTGAAGWHLIYTYQSERATTRTATDMVAPFEVTIICSHPGMISNRFPRQAKLRVIYRDDDAGRIDEEMAEEIAAAVGNRTSFVWVDQDGFRVAPQRPAN